MLVCKRFTPPNHSVFFDRNLQTGKFSDAKKQYYTQPQQLNSNGKIFGHQHITVQEIRNGKSALDPRNFAFFQGINTRAKDGRTLSVTVPPNTFKRAGQYRICSISGTFTHQPVIMPVAQRGSQDDCIRINVKKGGGGGGGKGRGKKQKKKKIRKLR